MKSFLLATLIAYVLYWTSRLVITALIIRFKGRDKELQSSHTFNILIAFMMIMYSVSIVNATLIAAYAIKTYLL